MQANRESIVERNRIDAILYAHRIYIGYSSYSTARGVATMGLASFV